MKLRRNIVNKLPIERRKGERQSKDPCSNLDCSYTFITNIVLTDKNLLLKSHVMLQAHGLGLYCDADID
jgi:hypothetical protein